METKIISFNIENASKGLLPLTKNYWKDRNRRIKTVISSLMPDVLCLNEATNLQVNDLDNQFCDKLKYERFGEYTYYPLLLSDCNPIYVNTCKYDVLDKGSFWLSETPNKKYSKMKGSKYWRNCNWVKLMKKEDRKTFYVFATHTNGNDGGEDHQRILMKEIYNIIEVGSEVIVCGDFNFFIDSGRLKTMTDFFDNAREIAKVGEEPTYHDRGDTNVRCAIDYFFTKNIEQLKYNIIKESADIKYLSDHYPIMITF